MSKNEVVERKLNVNIQDAQGRTPLIWMMASGKFSEIDEAALQALLDNGADKSIRDNSGKTAYDYAQQRHTELAPLLDV